MSKQRKLTHILIMGLSLTTIIPFLVIIHLVKPDIFGGATPFNAVSLVVIITLFIVYLGVYFLLSIGQTISQLSKDADVIARGELTHEVKPGRQANSEISSLATSLTSITKQMVSNVDELESRAILLERANSVLEKINTQKTEFVSIVSHELRAPLVNMKQSVSLLMDHQIGDITPDQEKTMAIISRNVDRLLDLIGDLLDVSAIDVGKLDTAKEKADLGEVINQAIGTVDRWRENKGLKLDVQLPEQMPAVYVDANRIVQVFTNLLSNAIKYTPPKGHITISAEVLERQIKISVSDTGAGIAKEDLNRVFDRFAKVSRPSREDFSYSTGLGLSIVKEIVKLHDGQIEVKSSVGKGSTFTVSLPLSEKGD